MKALLCLLLIVQTLVASHPDDSSRAALAMRTGILLRMHVVAQDDTAEMQRVKLCVRDAVHAAYADFPDEEGTMLAKAQAHLPELTRVAQAAAEAEGFHGSVAVSIETLSFDQRTLDGLTIPAGDYPAMMIRLGDAKGRNWWGLIDPSLALSCAAASAPDESGALVWDWSLNGLWQALLAGILPPQEEAAHE